MHSNDDEFKKIFSEKKKFDEQTVPSFNQLWYKAENPSSINNNRYKLVYGFGFSLAIAVIAAILFFQFDSNRDFEKNLIAFNSMKKSLSEFPGKKVTEITAFNPSNYRFSKLNFETKFEKIKNRKN